MTLLLKDDNGKELPKHIQDRVNTFIDGLKDVSWFKPKEGLKREYVDNQIKFTLECFGVKAGLEYKRLISVSDWASARYSIRDSSWDSSLSSSLASAFDSAWDSSLASAFASTWDSARASARSSAWYSAWDSAWASAELLVEDNEDFKYKYPNGAFKQLFKLREMGLYPVGVIDGKFVVYVPCDTDELPEQFRD